MKKNQKLPISPVMAVLLVWLEQHKEGSHAAGV